MATPVHVVPVNNRYTSPQIVCTWEGQEAPLAPYRAFTVSPTAPRETGRPGGRKWPEMAQRPKPTMPGNSDRDAPAQPGKEIRAICQRGGDPDSQGLETMVTIDEGKPDGELLKKVDGRGRIGP